MILYRVSTLSGMLESFENINEMSGNSNIFIKCLENFREFLTLHISPSSQNIWPLHFKIVSPGLQILQLENSKKLYKYGNKGIKNKWKNSGNKSNSVNLAPSTYLFLLTNEIRYFFRFFTENTSLNKTLRAESLLISKDKIEKNVRNFCLKTSGKWQEIWD